LNLRQKLGGGWDAFVNQFLGQEKQDNALIGRLLSEIVEICVEPDQDTRTFLSRLLGEASTSLSGALVHIDGRLDADVLPAADLRLAPTCAQDAVAMVTQLLDSKAVGQIVLDSWLRLPLEKETELSLFKDASRARRQYFGGAIERLAKACRQHSVRLIFVNEKTIEHQVLSDVFGLYCQRRLTVSNNDLIAFKANSNMATFVSAERCEWQS
jgi:hypothetical protein